MSDRAVVELGPYDIDSRPNSLFVFILRILRALRVHLFLEFKNTLVQGLNIDSLMNDPDSFAEQLFFIAVPNSTMPEPVWNIWNSIGFTIQIVTTIGFGYPTPHSPVVKTSIAFMALIPPVVFLVSLRKAGVALSKKLRYPYRWICIQSQRIPSSALRLKIPSPDKPIPLSFLIFGFIVYIPVAAFFFALLEGWDYFSSGYFFVVSTSTVGLGDMVPSSGWLLPFKYTILLSGLLWISTVYEVACEQYKVWRKEKCQRMLEKFSELAGQINLRAKETNGATYTPNDRNAIILSNNGKKISFFSSEFWSPTTFFWEMRHWFLGYQSFYIIDQELSYKGKEDHWKISDDCQAMINAFGKLCNQYKPEEIWRMMREILNAIPLRNVDSDTHMMKHWLQDKTVQTVFLESVEKECQSRASFMQGLENTDFKEENVCVISRRFVFQKKENHSAIQWSCPNARVTSVEETVMTTTCPSFSECSVATKVHEDLRIDVSRLSLASNTEHSGPPFSESSYALQVYQDVRLDFTSLSLGINASGHQSQETLFLDNMSAELGFYEMELTENVSFDPHLQIGILQGEQSVADIEFIDKEQAETRQARDAD